MTFDEMREEMKERFEDRREFYQPLFNPLRPVSNAIFAWCVAMTVALSAIDDTIKIDPEQLLNVDLLSAAVSCGSLLVCLISLASCAFCIFKGWDFINLIMYAAECFAVCLGFFVATKFPVADGTGALLYVTTLAVFCGLALGLGTYIAGRKLIGK